MKKLVWLSILGLALVLFISASALAHFGMIIPSNQMIGQNDDKNVHLSLMFWHPFQGQGMSLTKPAAFGVVTAGKKLDLLPTLKEKKVQEQATWETTYKVSKPGLNVFFMEPQPYWEPAEEKFIIHITKVYVAAFGQDEGWDKPIGLKTEIVPLSRPFGLYAGNVFQGQVIRNGKPAAGAQVEVEYYNEGQKGQAPNDLMVAQVIKTDPNGIFTYAAPKSGWWGFSAIYTDEQKMKHDGQDKDVEVSAVIWVKFYTMK